MRMFSLAASLIGGAAMVSGCGSSGVFDRERPDEFAVSRQAPLVIPPEFSLEPPRPGANRPQEVSTSQQTLDAMFGGPQARSQAETTTISRAGDSDPAIRSELGDPETRVVDKAASTRDIVSAPEGDGANSQAAIPQ